MTDTTNIIYCFRFVKIRFIPSNFLLDSWLVYWLKLCKTKETSIKNTYYGLLRRSSGSENTHIIWNRVVLFRYKEQLLHMLKYMSILIYFVFLKRIRSWFFTVQLSLLEHQTWFTVVMSIHDTQDALFFTNKYHCKQVDMLYILQ
jgi:hypothetical protein